MVTTHRGGVSSSVRLWGGVSRVNSQVTLRRPVGRIRVLVGCGWEAVTPNSIPGVQKELLEGCMRSEVPGLLSIIVVLDVVDVPSEGLRHEVYWEEDWLEPVLPSVTCTDGCTA